jgi:hypothetical protein
MKKLVFGLTLLLVAFLGISPAFAGMSGTSATGIQIQNLSQSGSAEVSFLLFNQAGGTAVSVPVTPNPILPGAFANIYMPSQTVGAGTYAGVLSSSSPLGAIIRTEWSATGGAATYSTVDPALSVTIPLVTYQYASQTSQFTVQNTDTTADATDVSVVLYKFGQSTPFASLTSQTIAAGTSKTYTLPDIKPGLAAGFVGSVVVSSATKPLVAQTFIDVSGSRGVSAFSGVATSSAATALYCPLVRANYYGDTGISVVNPNNADATVTITFRNLTNAYVQTMVVPANSSAVAFQGPGGNSRSGTTPPLPAGTGQTTANPTPTNNGFFGSAVITSPSPVLAMVTDALYGAGWSTQQQSSYNCQGAGDAGAVLAMPLLRNAHMTGPKLTTGVQIQNISGVQITVALELYNSDGTRRQASEPAPIVLPANGSGNFYSGNFPNTTNWVGSGILRVTAGAGTIVAVVNDANAWNATVATDSANYTAMKMVP